MQVQRGGHCEGIPAAIAKSAGFTLDGHGVSYFDNDISEWVRLSTAADFEEISDQVTESNWIKVKVCTVGAAQACR
jgi:hypothetical protein